MAQNGLRSTNAQSAGSVHVTAADAHTHAHAHTHAGARAASHAEPTRTASTYARFALAGGICASLNHFILVPVDVVKTRLQLSASPISPLTLTRTILREEGARALARGLAPTAVGYMLQGGFKFGLFELFMDKFRPASSLPALPLALLCAGAAEVVATTALCPMEAIRIKMVADAAFPGSIRGGLKTVISREGMGALYRGLPPLLFKQVPYTTTQLAAFAGLTTHAYSSFIPSTFGVRKADMGWGSQLAVSLSCGMLAGVISSIASQPGDTVLTRINGEMKAQAAGGGRVAPPTIAGVVQKLGWRGLWLGTGTRAGMTAVLSAGMFLVYDSMRVRALRALALDASP